MRSNRTLTPSTRPKTSYALVWLTYLAAALIIATASPIAITDSPSPFAGEWRLNVAETDLLREDIDEKGSILPAAGRMRGSINGIPLPGGGGQPQGMSPLAAKDPEVLRTRTMTITVSDRNVQLDYLDLSAPNNEEVLRRGHYRGRDSTWNKKKIEQKYKTSERKVSKKWSLRPDGRLLVRVQIKPSRAKKRNYNRVFDRTSATAETAATAGP